MTVLQGYRFKACHEKLTHLMVEFKLVWLTPPGRASAMQGINAVVRNAVFAFSFFGTLAFGGLTILLLIGAGGWPLALAILGTAIYGLGAFMVTLLYSVPLNEGLAAIVPTAENAAAIWQAYLEPWMFWNTLRMVMSVLTLAAFTASLVMLIARAPRAHLGVSAHARQIEPG